MRLTAEQQLNLLAGNDSDVLHVAGVISVSETSSSEGNGSPEERTPGLWQHVGRAAGHVHVGLTPLSLPALDPCSDGKLQAR